MALTRPPRRRCRLAMAGRRATHRWRRKAEAGLDTRARVALHGLRPRAPRHPRNAASARRRRDVRERPGSLARRSRFEHRHRCSAPHAHHGRRQVAASASQPVTAGDTTIPLSPVNPAPYWLDLAVTDSGGRYTSTRLAVVLGPSLTRSAARHAVEHRLYDEGIPFRVGKCHRVNSRRVDCEAQRARRCTAIHAVTLRSAFTFVRRYRCHAGVRRTPRWLEPAHPWPMLGKPAP